MVVINIRNEEILRAKAISKEFDEVKTYNKFKCGHNYIGVLGEIVFHRYLTEQGIEHKWVNFIKGKEYTKNIFSYPDFIIGNTSIDIKTTRSNCMWFQKPIHDLYIYAHIDKFNEKLNVIGYASKEMLSLAIGSDLVDEVTRGNRMDYVINSQDLIPIGHIMKEGII